MASRLANSNVLFLNLTLPVRQHLNALLLVLVSWFQSSKHGLLLRKAYSTLLTTLPLELDDHALPNAIAIHLPLYFPGSPTSSEYVAYSYLAYKNGARTEQVGHGARSQAK